MSYFRADGTIRAIFGEKAYRKLVQLLDPCCGNPSNLLPYKVYTALLTQDGANPPVAVELENTLGVTVDYQYAAPGQYVAIFSDTVFQSSNEYVVITGSFDTIQIGAAPVFFNALAIESYVSGAPTDGAIGSFIPCVLEIRIYN